MIEWRDEALVLSARPHGEAAAVVMLLTREHGRHAGLVRNAQSRGQRALYQPGNRLEATWRARLDDHLGTLTCEPMGSPGALLMDDAGRLDALMSAVALLERALPERAPGPRFYEGALALLEGLVGPHWAEVFVRWELAVLDELGFGLDLSACAGGGSANDLAYVSPKSGRAVSRAAAEPYKDRLLPLPLFLLGQASEDEAEARAEIAKGLRLSGHFLARHVYQAQDKPVPAPRERLEGRFLTASIEAPTKD